MIFLQSVLVPLRHKSLSCVLAVCPWIYTSGNAHIQGSYWSRTALKWWYFPKGTLTGQRRGGREIRECAHYTALTSEVRDRKEAGGHSTKLELRYFFCFSNSNRYWDLLFSEETEWMDKIISEHLFILHYYKSEFRLFNYFGNPCQNSKKNA